MLKRVPATEVIYVVERLFRAWLDGRGEGEPLQQFFIRHSDEELAAFGQPAGMAPLTEESDVLSNVVSE